MHFTTRNLSPETALLLAAAHVRLSNGAEHDRDRLRHAVESARERVHTPTERALLAASTAFLAGSASLGDLAAAEAAQASSAVPPRRKPSNEPDHRGLVEGDAPLFSHAAHVAAAMESE